MANSCINTVIIGGEQKNTKEFLAELLILREKNDKNPDEREKKYYFIHIDEVNGEEEYSHKQVFEIEKEEEVKAWIATKILMPWYGNGLDGVMHGDGELICYHKNNRITISVEDYKEITEEDYLILSKYI